MFRCNWCPVCGEYDSKNHVCKPAWYGWLEENADPDQHPCEYSITVHANTAYMAASCFCEKLCARDPEHFSSFENESADTVCVRRVSGGEIYRYDVSARLVAEFYPSEKK